MPHPPPLVLHLDAMSPRTGDSAFAKKHYAQSARLVFEMSALLDPLHTTPSLPLSEAHGLDGGILARYVTEPMVPGPLGRRALRVPGLSDALTVLAAGGLVLTVCLASYALPWHAALAAFLTLQVLSVLTMPKVCPIVVHPADPDFMDAWRALEEAQIRLERDMQRHAPTLLSLNHAAVSS